MKKKNLILAFTAMCVFGAAKFYQSNAAPGNYVHIQGDCTVCSWWPSGPACNPVGFRIVCW
jgi:hypothetical protein